MADVGTPLQSVVIELPTTSGLGRSSLRRSAPSSGRSTCMTADTSYEVSTENHRRSRKTTFGTSPTARESMFSVASHHLFWMAQDNLSDGEEDEGATGSPGKSEPTVLCRTMKFLLRFSFQLFHFVLEVMILKVYWSFDTHFCFWLTAVIVFVDVVGAVFVTLQDSDFLRWLRRMAPRLRCVMALPMLLLFGVLQLIHVKRAWARQIKVAEVIGQLNEAEYLWTGPALGAEPSRPLGFFTSTWALLISAWAWLFLPHEDKELGGLPAGPCILLMAGASLIAVTICVVEADIAISTFVARRYHFDARQRGVTLGRMQCIFPVLHWLYRCAEVLCQVAVLMLFVVFMVQESVSLALGLTLMFLRIFLDYAALVWILRRHSGPDEHFLVHCVVAGYMLLVDVVLFVDMPGFCYPAKRVSSCAEVWRLVVLIVSSAPVAFLQYHTRDRSWRGESEARWRALLAVFGAALLLRYVMRLTGFRSNGDDLHSAVAYGRTSRIKKLLEPGGGGEALDVDGSSRDERQCTPSMLAAEVGDVEALQQLLQAGASVAATDREGLTVLHYAARALQEGCLKLLRSQKRAHGILERQKDALQKLVEETCRQLPSRAACREGVLEALRPGPRPRSSQYTGHSNVRPVAVQARQLSRLFPDAVADEAPDMQELLSVGALVLAQELGPLARLLLVPAQAAAAGELNLADFKQVRVLGQGSFGSVIEVVEHKRAGACSPASSSGVVRLLSASVGNMLNVIRSPSGASDLSVSPARVSPYLAAPGGASGAARSRPGTPLTQSCGVEGLSAGAYKGGVLSNSLDLGVSMGSILECEASFDSSARLPWEPKRYAMKLQVKSQANSGWRVCSEALALQRVVHPFIVRLQHAFQTPQFFALLLELCDGGDLNQALCKNCQTLDIDGIRPGLAAQDAARYMGQILLALTHLHHENLVYRDMKPANVLLADGKQGGLVAKLSDFGTVRYIGKPKGPQGQRALRKRCMTLIGTQGFFAPELVFGDSDSEGDEGEEAEQEAGAGPRKGPNYYKTDAYSFGVTLAITLLGSQGGFAELISEDDEDEGDGEAIVPVGGSEEEVQGVLSAATAAGLISEDARELVSSLIRHRPRLRRQLADPEVMKHRFFLSTLQCQTDDLEAFLIHGQGAGEP